MQVIGESVFALKVRSQEDYNDPFYKMTRENVNAIGNWRAILHSTILKLCISIKLRTVKSLAQERHQPVGGGASGPRFSGFSEF